LGLIHKEVAFLWCPKQIFVVIGNIRFEIVQYLNRTFILNKSVNMLLLVSAIGNTVEIVRIRISLKDKLALGALVPFEFLPTKKACYLGFELIL
jgi:hypothetical protein